MNAFKWIGALFSSGSKGIVEQISDTADKWKPSPVTQHNMGIEDSKQAIAEQQAGDTSQASARAMQMPGHGTRFDVLVDGANRAVRPAFTYWILGGLAGAWELPPLTGLSPIMANIVWTVITFWFGSRLLVKDLPAAAAAIKSLMKK